MNASQLVAAVAASDLPRYYLCLPQQEHMLVWFLALCALSAIASVLGVLCLLAHVLRRYATLQRDLLSVTRPGGGWR